MLNAHTFHFYQNSKICNIILKTEQMTIVFARWDLWASRDVIASYDNHWYYFQDKSKSNQGSVTIWKQWESVLC